MEKKQSEYIANLFKQKDDLWNTLQELKKALGSKDRDTNRLFVGEGHISLVKNISLKSYDRILKNMITIIDMEYVDICIGCNNYILNKRDESITI
jgi:hypothetical protein